ncbi:MAG TPA: hypothetical protein VH877_07725 [Polyangia bacterium]|nr:hypothetical protein [Polyangia bacterium]
MRVRTSSRPGKTVLAETPARVLKFLGAVSKSPSIYKALVGHGYTRNDHQEGWQLLLRAAGYYRLPPLLPDDAGPGVAALAQLDDWAGTRIRLLRVALGRRSPEQAAALFAGPLDTNLVRPGSGGSVLAVQALLDRVDDLEKGAQRKDAPEADRAALALLAQRGLTQEERRRLRGLIEVVKTGGATLTGPVGAAEGTEEEGGEEQDLRKLRAWYEEWAATARVGIRRRDHLIQLGLAHRKSAARQAQKAARAAKKPT